VTGQSYDRSVTKSTLVAAGDVRPPLPFRCLKTLDAGSKD
jgi:hypothetical protein